MDQQDDDYVIICRDDANLRADSRPAYASDISSYIDSIADSIWPVNKKIHDNPELNYEEHIAHETLVRFMRSQEGWKVTQSAYQIETAWVAVYDSGRKGPVVSFNVEMGNASVSAGLATAEMMRRHSLPGKAILFGTPAEEGGGGKIKLIQRGAYKDHKVDVNFISHPGITYDCALMRTTAYTRFKVEYFGREAHAAASPWLGINALDALVTAYNALSVLRQQTMPGDIIQGHITDGGAAPNIIHAHAAGVFVVRADTKTGMRELKAKVDACFEAGAKATNAKLKMTPLQEYADHVPNWVLAQSYTRYFNSLIPEKEDPYEPPTSRIPIDQNVDEARGVSRASTDQGDISYEMPSLSAGFSIAPGPEGQGPHNPDFAVAAGTRDAFERCLTVGKALAGTALDVLTKKGMLEEVRAAWEKDMEKHGKARRDI
ncbi:Peptidase M20 domain-containing protein 2 [Cytospora mali]|uniref:Peptidase M20 domain-containing protein 2 n=1 Tax=Cytospora mali TaxID=578113 RepID=A0A194VZV6_CYTMA|nr:Peptidase M20 domain-containing protein 2 [Valsa mali]